MDTNWSGRGGCWTIVPHRFTTTRPVPGVSHPEMLKVFIGSSGGSISFWLSSSSAWFPSQIVSHAFHFLSNAFKSSGVERCPYSVFLEPLQIKGDRLTHLFRHQLIGLDACTQCQRCEETCPVTMANERFSPLKILQELKEVSMVQRTIWIYWKRQNHWKGFGSALPVVIAKSNAPFPWRL